MNRTIVLFRNAKLFYKIHKLLGNKAMTGYSHDGTCYYPDNVDNMVSGKRCKSTTYPLVGWLSEQDMML